MNANRHKVNLKPIALHTDPETNWPTDTMYLRADGRLLGLRLKEPFGQGSRRWTPPTDEEVLEYRQALQVSTARCSATDSA